MQFERCRNVTIGWVDPGEFWSLPNVSFSFGPLNFSLHDLDSHDWVMSFSQKRTIANRMRGYLRIHPRSDRQSGFTVKLPNREYGGWVDLLEDLRSVGPSIKFGAKQEIRRGADHVLVEQEPFMEAIRRHNAELLESLGDWRPTLTEAEIIQFQHFVEAMKDAA